MLSNSRLLRLVLLAALALTAAWLRFSSISFGLPDQLRPDEELLVPRALDFEGSWNPHIAEYPAGQIYIVHAVLRSYAILTGRSVEDLRTAYAEDNGARAFLVARWTSAAMGAATVPVLYAAAAPVFGAIAALSSATILAVTSIHVRDSKFAKVEVPAGFWLALSILTLLRIPTRGRPMDYGFAGLFCGLAAGTHYPAGAVSIAILVAHLEGRRREGKSLRSSLVDWRIYLAAFLAMLAFLCVDPYFLLDWPQTVHDFTVLRNNYRMWNGGNTPAGFGWHWLLLRAMPAGFGIELEIFLMAALVWVLFRRRPGTYALLAFVVACFLSLTNGHPQLEFRYLVNPLMAMALLGGVLADDLGALARQLAGSTGGRLAVLAGLLLVTPSLVRDVQANQLLRQSDTRSIARQWMLGHIPTPSVIALLGGDGYGKPKLAGRGYILIPVHTLPGLENATTWAQWIVVDSFPPLILWSHGATAAEMDVLNSKGKLEFDVDSLSPGAATPEFDPNDAFYVPFNHFTSMTRPGPRVRVWRMTSNSAN